MGVIHHFEGSKGAWDWEDISVHDYGKHESVYGNKKPGKQVC